MTQMTKVLCNNNLPASLALYPYLVILCCMSISLLSSNNTSDKFAEPIILVLSYAYLAIPFVLTIGIVLAPFAITLCRDKPGHTAWIVALIGMLITCVLLNNNSLIGSFFGYNNTNSTYAKKEVSPSVSPV